MKTDQPEKRVVVTGMSVITTLGDSLDAFHSNLLRGKSGISRWKQPDYAAGYSKIGADLSDYDIASKTSSFQDTLPHAVYRRLVKLVNKSPWATKMSILAAVQAVIDAGLLATPADPDKTSTILAGHYMHEMYKSQNDAIFASDPDAADVLFGITEWETDTAACICDVLGIFGPSQSTGGACAAGNIALRMALDEIRHHDADVVLIIGSIVWLTPATLYSLAKLGAISIEVFDDTPERASRPFDVKRNGFVPSQGCGVLVVEKLSHAIRRGARIHAEVAGVAINCNGSRNPSPSKEHIRKVMAQALLSTGTDRTEIDYISAHATSTPLGDKTEIQAIKQVFGDHAKTVKINALKSMMGHTLSASAVIETVASILQMQSGRLYPSINIDQRDPDVDLDICANHAVDHRIHCMMKNAFGFGGINSASILRRYP